MHSDGCCSSRGLGFLCLLHVSRSQQRDNQHSRVFLCRIFAMICFLGVEKSGVVTFFAESTLEKGIALIG